MAIVPSKKGLSFVAVRDYVGAEFDERAWAEVLGTLSARDAETLKTVVGVGWYPIDLYSRLIRAADTTLGKGDLGMVRRVTRFEAERDLPTIHRLLLRIVRPTFVIEKMGELWSRYNSTGRFVIELRGERGVEGTIHDWSNDRALCLGTQHYADRALELAGARGVRTQHVKCRASGDATCVIRATWSGKDDPV